MVRVPRAPRDAPRVVARCVLDLGTGVAASPRMRELQPNQSDSSTAATAAFAVRRLLRLPAPRRTTAGQRKPRLAKRGTKRPTRVATARAKTQESRSREHLLPIGGSGGTRNVTRNEPRCQAFPKSRGLASPLVRRPATVPGGRLCTSKTARVPRSRGIPRLCRIKR